MDRRAYERISWSSTPPPPPQSRMELQSDHRGRYLRSCPIPEKHWRSGYRVRESRLKKVIPSFPLYWLTPSYCRNHPLNIPRMLCFTLEIWFLEHIIACRLLVSRGLLQEDLIKAHLKRMTWKSFKCREEWTTYLDSAMSRFVGSLIGSTSGKATIQETDASLFLVLGFKGTEEYSLLRVICQCEWPQCLGLWSFIQTIPLVRTWLTKPSYPILEE